jgi:FixJ family two-component response regulator
MDRLYTLGPSEVRLKEGHIFLVEDDPSVRRAIARVLRAAGYAVEVHSTPLSFLQDSAGEDRGACCVVVDVSLPGMSGLDLQKELAAAALRCP